MARKGLGKGLGAIFGSDISVEKNENATGTLMVDINLVEPNKNQPRKDFRKEDLEELTNSVKQYGIIQPIIVKKKDNQLYEIIAGERRWRAAKSAGLEEVPIVVRELSEREAMEISIIENVQRSDLNPIEEALGYQVLMKEYGLKQEEVAKKVAKSRVTIANALRLLKLSEPIQKMMIEGKLSSGHARALLNRI